MSALHKPILRALHQSTLYWIAVNIAQLLDAFSLAPLFYFQSLDPELEIVIACLPEGLRLNIGTSGNRIVLHLVNAMKRLGAKRGIATECIGGGQGGAMLIETIWGVGHGSENDIAHRQACARRHRQARSRARAVRRGAGGARA